MLLCTEIQPHTHTATLPLLSYRSSFVPSPDSDLHSQEIGSGYNAIGMSDHKPDYIAYGHVICCVA